MDNFAGCLCDFLRSLQRMMIDIVDCLSYLRFYHIMINFACRFPNCVDEVSTRSDRFFGNFIDWTTLDCFCDCLIYFRAFDGSDELPTFVYRSFGKVPNGFYRVVDDFARFFRQAVERFACFLDKAASLMDSFSCRFFEAVPETAEETGVF